ncbi:hypothetical protein AEB_P1399 [Altererythrobacter sp. B11]|nr:hypothetical protein AEB_P1399 [Altererythrobacter sp. B11]
MPFQQGAARAELGENLVFGHRGKEPFDPVAPASSAAWRRCAASRKNLLEPLEACGKRAYRRAEYGPFGGLSGPWGSPMKNGKRQKR